MLLDQLGRHLAFLLELRVKDRNPQPYPSLLPACGAKASPMLEELLRSALENLKRKLQAISEFRERCLSGHNPPGERHIPLERADPVTLPHERL